MTTGTSSFLAELARGREVICMGMRVDDVMDPHAVAHRRDLIAVDLVNLGIDQRRGTSFLAADQIGLAAAGRDLLEDHACPRFGGRS